jgi:hypothetical protein
MAQRLSAAVDASDLAFQTWRALEQDLAGSKNALLEPVMPIQKFQELAEKQPTPPAQRRRIVDQAELLIDNLYPHLPFKRDLYQVIPTSGLFNDARAKIKGPEIRFHDAMLEAFSLMRDAHTIYGLPSPFSGALAFLPFRLDTVEFTNPPQRFFVVASVMNSRPIAESGRKGWRDGFGHEFFGPGVIILRWGGLPILEHISAIRNASPGGNQAAFFRRAAMASTTRLLGFTPLPFDYETPVAEIVYRLPVPGGGKDGGPEHTIRIPWGVARFPSLPEIPGRSFSMSYVTDELDRATEKLHDRKPVEQQPESDAPANPVVVSRIPDVFEIQFAAELQQKVLKALAGIQFPDLRIACLRIKAFRDQGDPSTMTVRLVAEMQRILTILDREAPDGLVLDIRGNPGGDIEAAERMLQMLTPRHIVPQKFHLAFTDGMVKVLRNVRALLNQPGLSEEDADHLDAARQDLQAWFGAEDEPEADGRLTAGRPLTNENLANQIGQVYHGPVALLIDGATYSAADIFAAGFQDHAIGPILGAEGCTGGGGANVANHSMLVRTLGPRPGIKIAPLPAGVFMRVAYRRCARAPFLGRVAPSLPLQKWVEDYGVAADLPLYQANIVQDVLAGMPGLIATAAQKLARMQPFRIDVQNFDIRDGAVIVVFLISSNISALRYLLDGNPADPAPGENNAIRFPLAPGAPRPSRLTIQAFTPPKPGAPQELVAVRNVDLRQSDDVPAEVAVQKQAAGERRRDRAQQERARDRRAKRRGR